MKNKKKKNENSFQLFQLFCYYRRSMERLTGNNVIVRDICRKSWNVFNVEVFDNIVDPIGARIAIAVSLW